MKILIIILFFSTPVFADSYSNRMGANKAYQLRQIDIQQQQMIEQQRQAQAQEDRNRREAARQRNIDRERNGNMFQSYDYNGDW